MCPVRMWLKERIKSFLREHNYWETLGGAKTSYPKTIILESHQKYKISKHIRYFLLMRDTYFIILNATNHVVTDVEGYSFNLVVQVNGFKLQRVYLLH